MEQNVDVIDLNNVKAQKKTSQRWKGRRVVRGTHLGKKRNKKLSIIDGTRN